MDLTSKLRTATRRQSGVEASRDAARSARDQERARSELLVSELMSARSNRMDLIEKLVRATRAHVLERERNRELSVDMEALRRRRDAELVAVRIVQMAWEHARVEIRNAELCAARAVSNVWANAQCHLAEQHRSPRISTGGSWVIELSPLLENSPLEEQVFEWEHFGPSEEQQSSGEGAECPPTLKRRRGQRRARFFQKWRWLQCFFPSRVALRPSSEPLRAVLV